MTCPLLSRLPETALLATIWLGLSGVPHVYAQPTDQAGTGSSATSSASTPERPVVRRIVAPGQTADTAQPDSASTPAASGRSPAIGETTRRLLAAQANPDRPGSHLPILGATAQLSWQRYLDSFRQPLPEWFDERLEKD
ncbi:DUF3613 domain-containing protein [Corticimicrobacter populi]|uniref:DUF3613 domain-containing protein n=1 Tax=Corticimicrobacter populi TaxID=2175229 RepID=A0A2V1JXK5_9BURK|nr:DUF3613 domain-containing protein [Corticimicrobacter populi]PWF22234.1 DUF3613 domain-containing protein [Corticimicrobacter populi]